MANNLYGWFPSMDQPLPTPDSTRWQIPERSPGNLAPGALGTMGPMSQLAYNLAGRPSMKPPASVTMPGVPYAEGGDAPSGGGGMLGNLNSLNSLYRQGNNLYDMLGGGSSVAPVAGAAQPIDLSAIGSAGLGSIGAGAMFGTSGASALGAAAPVAADTALANLGTISAGQLFGTSGSVAAGAGPGSLGATGGTSALTSGAGGATGASGAAGLSGLGAGALGLGIVALASPYMSQHGDEIRNAQAFNQAFPDIDMSLAQRSRGNMVGKVVLPDGRTLSSDEYEKLAGAWYGATYAPDGNQAEWQKKYDRLNSSLGATEGYWYFKAPEKQRLKPKG